MKLVTAVIVLLIAASALAVSGGPAWALPCTGGERLTGSTPSHWECTNLETGVTRLVLR